MNETCPSTTWSRFLRPRPSGPKFKLSHFDVVQSDLEDSEAEFPEERDVCRSDFFWLSAGCQTDLDNGERRTNHFSDAFQRRIPTPALRRKSFENKHLRKFQKFWRDISDGDFWDLDVHLENHVVNTQRHHR
jgi:hypothetical protein